MCSAGGIPILSGWVAPFGNLRLSLLDNKPELIAVLPRPSSALDAKASTVCPLRLTCFRINIRPYFDTQLHIQFLKCGRQKKRSGGFAHQTSLSGFLPPVLAYYVSAFTICKYKDSTGKCGCQQLLRALEKEISSLCTLIVASS